MDDRNEFQRRIGVGEPQHLFGRHAGGTNVTTVVADEGPLRGQEVGRRREHWSGRVDAKVDRPTITPHPNFKIERKAP